LVFESTTAVLEGSDGLLYLPAGAACDTMAAESRGINGSGVCVGQQSKD